MALGVDGLVSGLDTTSLINQLMQVEAGPQTALKSKQSSTKALVTALQALNTKTASLGTTAATAAKPESWSVWKASVTGGAATAPGAGATASASASAQPGTLTFTVDAVAQAQLSVTKVFSAASELFPTQPPTVTIQKADGTLVSVQPTTGDLAAVTKAINDASAAGVKATAVKVADGSYRLQFTGTTTGTAGAFTVYAGTSEQVTAGTATKISGDTAVRAATDATVTLWKDSAYEKSFTQSSNTFTGLMTGVDITVSAVTGPADQPVTVTVARNDEALEKLTSDLVAGLNLVLQEVASRTRTTTTTNSDGSTSVTGGLFTGDGTIRQLAQQLATAASSPVDGRSPSTVGIVIGKDGAFTFDKAKFAAALAADPARVQSTVSALAGRVQEVTTAASDPAKGSLTLKIKGQEGLVKDFGTQIESWDRRLELRRTSLERTYAALEVTLSKMQSQSSWLAGQLSSLSTNWSAD